MSFILKLIVFVLVLGIIVAIHELGHLIFAKRAKIQCYEYSIGMGPVLYKKKGKETDFAIRAIPIGGFVSMAGEELSTEMIKKGDIIGLVLEEEKIKRMVLTNKVKSDLIIKVTNFEIYDEEETGDLYIEGMVEGNLEHYKILDDAVYVVSEKQELKIAPYNRCFESKTYWEKFLTLIAGPGMNFLLALFLFLIVAMFQGKPQDINVIGGVIEGMPAQLAGIDKDDEILFIGDYEVTNWSSISNAIKDLDSFEDVNVLMKKANTGQTEEVKLDLQVNLVQLGITNFNEEGIKKSNEGAIIGQNYDPSKRSFEANDVIKHVKYKDKEFVVNNWRDLITAVEDFEGGDIEITLLRDEETITETFEGWELAVLKSQGGVPYSVSLGIMQKTKFSLGYALTAPFVGIWNTFKQIIAVLVFLFGGSKQVGVGDLSGPIGIFQIVGDVMGQGMLALLSFTAFLSVNIGILNLLPIPALDGGRILFISIEAITRKKIPRKVENIVNNVFFILLMLLFVFVAVGDIRRLFFAI